jgi:hypothetical protein
MSHDYTPRDTTSECLRLLVKLYVDRLASEPDNEALFPIVGLVIPICKTKSVNDLFKQVQHAYSLKFPANKSIECHALFIRECFEIADTSFTVEQCFDDYSEIKVQARST